MSQNGHTHNNDSAAANCYCACDHFVISYKVLKVYYYYYSAKVLLFLKVYNLLSSKSTSLDITAGHTLWMSVLSVCTHPQGLSGSNIQA